MTNDLVVASSPKALISEGFRTLRTNLQFSTVDEELKTIAIVSSMQGEGKSFVSSNLACAFAQSGEKVLLVDCDMRRGRLHKVFNVSNEEGFSNLLISDIRDYESYIKKTEIKNLSVLPMGAVPPNPAELLASSKNEKLMEIFKEKFDIIIYDCVPVTGLTDSLIMAKLVDKTVIVSASKLTPLELLQNTKKSLINVGANIAGVVFNRVQTDGSIYANKYYGKYYTS
jgi:capsular exopolysaccharide synthesis family protein